MLYLSLFVHMKFFVVVVCFEFELLKTQPCCFALYQRGAKKGRLVTYLLLLPHISSSRAYDVTDTDLQATK